MQYTYTRKTPLIMYKWEVEEEASYDEYGGVEVFHLRSINDRSHDQIT